MSKVNRNCFLSVDSCLLDLSVGSIFKIDKLSRISWKSIHSVLASSIHLFGGVGKKKILPTSLSLLCSDLCSIKPPALPVQHDWRDRVGAGMGCGRQGLIYAFDDSGINIKNTIAVYEIGTVRRKSSD